MPARSLINMRALRVPGAALSGRMPLSTSARLFLKESSSRTYPLHLSGRSSLHTALHDASFLNTGTLCRPGIADHTTPETDVDYDKHKQDSLRKQKEGAGHWKPELASDSEEAVKADRHPNDDPKTLQEKTKHAAEESSKSGTSVRDSMQRH